MENINFIAGAEGLDVVNIISSMIKNSCIIDYGIVQEVIADGVVNVSLAVANTAEDIKCFTCVLANIASDALTINIKPKVGDRVLIVYPKLYSDEMFTLAEKEEDRALVTVEAEAKGYNMLSGIAILMNQYKEGSHKNFVTFDEGKLEAHLAYSKDDDKTLFDLNIEADGAVTIKDNKVNLNINSDNEITVDNSKAEIKVDKEGNVSIDAKSGKITLKNNSASLFTILDGMLQTLNTSLATAGSPASHTVVPQQFSQQSTQLGQLMK